MVEFEMSIGFISFNAYFADIKRLDAQCHLCRLTGANALLSGASITKIALSPTEGTLIWTIFAGPSSSTNENIP